MKQIHDSLERVFDRHRLVFWYDAAGEWADTYNSFEHPKVTKIEVRNTEFGTKVRIVQDPNPAAKVLVYIPSPKPDDRDNWLLDLLLQGHEYKADKASLALQQVCSPHSCSNALNDERPLKLCDRANNDNNCPSQRAVCVDCFTLREELDARSFSSSSTWRKCFVLRAMRSTDHTRTVLNRCRWASFRSLSSAGRRALVPLTPRSVYSSQISNPRWAAKSRKS